VSFLLAVTATTRQKDAVLVEVWMHAGRLFHTAGPAWLNAHSPKTVFNVGILYTSALLADQTPGWVVAITASCTLLLRQWGHVDADCSRGCSRHIRFGHCSYC